MFFCVANSNCIGTFTLNCVCSPGTLSALQEHVSACSEITQLHTELFFYIPFPGVKSSKPNQGVTRCYGMLGMHS